MENLDGVEEPQNAPESTENKDVKFIDLFDPRVPRSEQELIEARLAICNTCELLNPRLMRCTKCGCFMQLKSTLKQAKCPIGKW